MKRAAKRLLLLFFSYSGRSGEGKAFPLAFSSFMLAFPRPEMESGERMMMVSPTAASIIC